MVNVGKYTSTMDAMGSYLRKFSFEILGRCFRLVDSGTSGITVLSMMQTQRWDDRMMQVGLASKMLETCTYWSLPAYW